MNAWREWREAALKQSLLRSWRNAGALDADGVFRAQHLLGVAPSAASWRWCLERFGLWLGVALSAAGMICFIAANWEHLGKFARLYGFQVLLVIAVAAAAKLGLARAAGQAALWLATMVLGGVLALIGQTYQTGADTWELFALWSALSLPWTFAGRNATQWLTWAGLLNLAFGLWMGLRQSDIWFDNHALSAGLGMLNLLLLLTWETAGRRWPGFIEHFDASVGARLGRWLLGAAALTLLSFAAIDERLGNNQTEWVLTCIWLAASVALVWWYWRKQRDLPILAMCALSIIAVVTANLSDLVFVGQESASDFLIVAFAVIAQATVATLLLRRLAREGAQ